MKQIGTGIKAFKNQDIIIMYKTQIETTSIQLIWIVSILSINDLVHTAIHKTTSNLP